MGQGEVGTEYFGMVYDLLGTDKVKVDRRGDEGDSDESFVQFLINQMTTIDLSNNDDILLNNKDT